MSMIKRWYDTGIYYNPNKATYENGNEIKIDDLVILEFGINQNQIQKIYDFIGDTPCKVIGYNGTYNICIQSTLEEHRQKCKEIKGRNYLIIYTGFKKANFNCISNKL